MVDVRECLKEYIGARLLDVSQEDEGEEPFIFLMFDNGLCMKITFTGTPGIEEIDDV